MIVDEGVEVVVPPRRHRVVTARVEMDATPSALQEARHALERRSRSSTLAIRRRLQGLALTVAWGLPYFRRFVPAQARREIPIDRRASARARPRSACSRKPSGSRAIPRTTILERNDVAVLLRSDNLDALDDAHGACSMTPRDLRVTSIRTGFVGGGFQGRRSLPNGWRPPPAFRVRCAHAGHARSSFSASLRQ